MNLQLVYSILRAFLLIVAIVVGFYLLLFISKITYPFLIALFIALIINPFVNILTNQLKIPRAFSVIIILVLLIGIVAGLVTLLIAEIISGSNYLKQVVPKHFETLVTYIEDFFADQIIPVYHQLAMMFNKLEAGQQATIMSNIEKAGKSLTENVTLVIQNIFEGIPTFLGQIPNVATVLIFSLLATFFISKDWYRLGRLFSNIIPNKIQKSGHSIFVELKKALFGFIKAQITLISITAVIVLAGLLFLQVNYAVTIALIIGIVDLLPYLGTGLVFVPWIVYAFFATNYKLAIGLSILYGIVVIQRQIMEPKVLSSSIGLDPLATLIALFVGFKLIGFLGLIVGPVTLVIIKTLHHANVFEDTWSFIVGKKL